MRREDEIHRSLAVRGEFLHGLGMMAMAGHAVRLEVVGCLREQEADLRLASGARRARLAIGDQMLGVDHARFDERH